ncbi:MAG: MFS transporter [Candidatus Bathyarchaeota archaeon]|nr:MFS transporter [Candidatus Bathyarchaeota archaeon A05DMB-3]MDH7606622.1 MFS transporter [Candidatus Bathyarchaeota archaeon]
MQTSDFKNLGVASSIYFFSSNLTSMFLPVYYLELGLGISDIALLLLITFAIIGLLPITLLRFVKSFERVICFGVLSTMVFYTLLIFVKNSVVLGVTYGLSIATFWPSFNLLQFRLSESSIRARSVSLFSIIIPSIASIAGPAAGGLIIENFGFHFLLILSIILYFVALTFFMRVQFKLEAHRLWTPWSGKFSIFFITFIIFGMSEAYWLAYPLFVNRVSETISRMGFVLASTSVVISAITFLVNWLSDVKMRRVEFTIIGVMLNAAWFFLIGFASMPHEIVLLSALSGLASAFTISWFAHYGDSFSREYYASILVLMETGLMIGRIINLVPMRLFISEGNYLSYFMLLGVFTLSVIPFLAYSKHLDGEGKAIKEH